MAIDFAPVLCCRCQGGTSQATVAIKLANVTKAHITSICHLNTISRDDTLPVKTELCVIGLRCVKLELERNAHFVPAEQAANYLLARHNPLHGIQRSDETYCNNTAGD